MCRKIAQDEANGLKVIAIEIPSQKAYSIEIEKLAEKINQAADLIDKGENVDAVSISISKDVKISLLADFMNIKFDSANIHKYKEQIREWLLNPKISTKVSGIMEYQQPGSTTAMTKDFLKVAQVIKAIERISNSGKNIPVFLSAGNEGEEFLNLFSLAKNVKAIGATDYNGNLADFSADNTLMSDFEQGIFNVSTVYNKNHKLAGYDITGNGRITIPKYMTSGKKSEVVDYTNNPSASVIANEQDYQEMIEMLNRVELIKRQKHIDDYTVGVCFDEQKQEFGENKKVFPASLLKTFMPDSTADIEKLEKEGNFINATATRAFKLKNGKLVYDPDGSGRESIGKIWGTSFAAPFAMAKYIKNKTKTLSFTSMFGKNFRIKQSFKNNMNL